MNTEKLITTAHHHKPKKLVRSQYKDIMIKVDEDIYYLDRLQLALKSGYFEKLFVQDFSERNTDLIEIPLIDTDTFSAVVDLIYGAKLRSVVNGDNYVSLLMAMDYLQMDIDVEIYEDLIRDQFNCGAPLNKYIFQLYHFVAENSDYHYFFDRIFGHLSDNLEKMIDRDEFLLISFDHLIQIISYVGFASYEKEIKFSPFHTLSKICAKWICHDLENRLAHMIDLVHAARSRFFIPNQIARKDLGLRLSDTDEMANMDLISSKFYQLLTYCGEIRSSDYVKSELRKEDYSSLYGKKTTVPEINYPDCDSCDSMTNFFDKLYCSANKYLFSKEPKLKTFLENSNFYDITIKAGEKTYKLHRCVLRSLSLYFEEIFSKEYSKISAQSEGIPTPPSKDKIYSLDDIDSDAFDIIVDHIYLGKVQFTCDVVVRLFKAIHILRIDSLKKSCCDWMENTRNSDDICSKDVIEMLNFTYVNVEYEDLNRFFLSKYIVNCWPKIENLPQFADLFKAITLPEKTHSTDEGEVYLLDKVDQETFKDIIDHVYLYGPSFNENNIIRILKASEMFKIEDLMRDCVEWLVENSKKISDNDVVEVLRFARRITKYEVLQTVYLVKYMMKWPRIKTSLFCRIPFDCLQNMLMSPDLCSDDPLTILDICSKWVVHDARNRYRLIPRIALAISRNCLIDGDDYPFAIPSDFKQCSQDFVKDKLLEVLSSTSVFPSTVSSKKKTKKQKTKPPVFIMTNKDKLFSVLNSDWDEIVSFRLCENMPNCSIKYSSKFPVSATMVNDNLFILYTMGKCCFFHVYSVSSKKLFSLSSPRIYKTKKTNKDVDNLKCALLNCRNEIYCCLSDGEMLKYSLVLNRWMPISQPELDKDGICFASDGNELYRMYKREQTDSLTDYSAEVYDFQQNSWISAPSFPHLTLHHASHNYPEKNEHLRGLVFFNKYGLAVVFRTKLFRFNRKNQTWRSIDLLPYEHYVNIKHSILGQDETDEMLHVMNNALYRFSLSSRSWQFVKELPLRETRKRSYIDEHLRYKNMISIHNPSIRNY